MRNIFELTKHEQRIVIVIVVTLVAFAFAKHLWQTKSRPSPVRLKSTPAASPALQSQKEESESDHER